jgi:pimeloyl-ACP methyl ester carboxylesterase
VSPAASAYDHDHRALDVAEVGDEDAPLVVLVHGALDRARSLRRVVERLPDLHVVTYDRRGYGGSVAMGPPTSMRQHVDDLIEVLHGRRATVVGHSVGDYVAILASIARPDLVASLGLWEPPTPWMDFWPERAKRSVAHIIGNGVPAEVGERGARMMLGDEGWDRLSDDARELRRAEGRAFLVDAAAESEPLYEWADVHVPCIIGYGERTWPWTLDSSQRAAADLGCGTFVIAGSTHLGNVSHPDEFADFVRQAVALGR